MNHHFAHHPHQKLPPFPHGKNECFKTHFFQKWKKQEQSFINMNRSMAQKGPPASKMAKKYSLENKPAQSKNQSLIGSCKIVPKIKAVSKSRSTQHIPKDVPHNNVRTNTRRIPKNKIDQQIKIYQWRISTHFPIVKVGFVGSRQITQKNAHGQSWTQLQLQITWAEDVKFHLHEIDQFNLLNSLYILDESLVSFERLYNKFGYFEPTLKMIFITNAYRCRIWPNENFWENTPLPSKFVSKEHQKVEFFYKKIIKLFSQYFRTKIQQHNNHEGFKKSVNLIQKLIYELQRKTDFVQGMKFINEFLTAYSLKINNRFIYPIDVPSNRSRIFTKMESSHPVNAKITTLPEIPLSKEYPELQDMHVKTLKNSYHQYKEVLQSNVRTIIDKRSQTKQIPFKKKSQVSICSKQTIVEKKSRFSLHEPKEGSNYQQYQEFNPLINILPNFTNEDFNEQENDIIIINEPKLVNSKQDQNDGAFDPDKINDEQEYEDQVRNVIEKNVRERNGWLQSPLLLFDADDCAKSYQDSQPSVKIKNRERKLTKLNRIKSSIANSIVD